MISVISVISYDDRRLAYVFLELEDWLGPRQLKKANVLFRFLIGLWLDGNVGGYLLLEN